MISVNTELPGFILPTFIAVFFEERRKPFQHKHFLSFLLETRYLSVNPLKHGGGGARPSLPCFLPFT